mmetsp:Transcript_81569/g.162290  ORF Transcript_81569/g.162290 Transcript_81569/m.162290 type:complete len:775 (+) Transcript_81569:2485-4809(+)
MIGPLSEATNRPVTLWHPGKLDVIRGSFIDSLTPLIHIDGRRLFELGEAAAALEGRDSNTLGRLDFCLSRRAEVDFPMVPHANLAILQTLALALCPMTPLTSLYLTRRKVNIQVRAADPRPMNLVAGAVTIRISPSVEELIEGQHTAKFGRVRGFIPAEGAQVVVRALSSHRCALSRRGIQLFAGAVESTEDGVGLDIGQPSVLHDFADPLVVTAARPAAPMTSEAVHHCVGELVSDRAGVSEVMPIDRLSILSYLLWCDLGGIAVVSFVGLLVPRVVPAALVAGCVHGLVRITVVPALVPLSIPQQRRVGQLVHAGLLVENAVDAASKVGSPVDAVNTLIVLKELALLLGALRQRSLQLAISPFILRAEADGIMGAAVDAHSGACDVALFFAEMRGTVGARLGARRASGARCLIGLLLEQLVVGAAEGASISRLVRAKPPRATIERCPISGAISYVRGVRPGPSVSALLEFLSAVSAMGQPSSNVLARSFRVRLTRLIPRHIVDEGVMVFGIVTRASTETGTAWSTIAVLLDFLRVAKGPGPAVHLTRRNMQLTLGGRFVFPTDVLPVVIVNKVRGWQASILRGFAQVGTQIVVPPLRTREVSEACRLAQARIVREGIDLAKLLPPPRPAIVTPIGTQETPVDALPRALSAGQATHITGWEGRARPIIVADTVLFRETAALVGGDADVRFMSPFVDTGHPLLVVQVRVFALALCLGVLSLKGCEHRLVAWQAGVRLLAGLTNPERAFIEVGYAEVGGEELPWPVGVQLMQITL